MPRSRRRVHAGARQPPAALFRPSLLPRPPGRLSALESHQLRVAVEEFGVRSAKAQVRGRGPSAQVQPTSMPACSEVAGTCRGCRPSPQGAAGMPSAAAAVAAEAPSRTSFRSCPRLHAFQRTLLALPGNAPGPVGAHHGRRPPAVDRPAPAAVRAAPWQQRAAGRTQDRPQETLHPPGAHVGLAGPASRTSVGGAAGTGKQLARG
jgi:hypothetical protein